MSLNPVTYNCTVEGQKSILQTGLIPQEVDAAAKQAGVDFNGVDKSGVCWGIHYATLTVPLIKGIQEIEQKHRGDLELLNSRIEKLEAALLQRTEMTITSIEKSFLYQNQPNPFNDATTIGYMITAIDKNAVLVTGDLNGRTLKQATITAGKGSATINAGELSAGTYTYSLIINGECTDSKLMVIAKYFFYQYFNITYPPAINKSNSPTIVGLFCWLLLVSWSELKTFYLIALTFLVDHSAQFIQFIVRGFIT